MTLPFLTTQNHTIKKAHTIFWPWTCFHNKVSGVRNKLFVNGVFSLSTLNICSIQLMMQYLFYLLVCKLQIISKESLETTAQMSWQFNLWILKWYDLLHVFHEIKNTCLQHSNEIVLDFLITLCKHVLFACKCSRWCHSHHGNHFLSVFLCDVAFRSYAVFHTFKRYLWLSTNNTSIGITAVLYRHS